jgi:hypothetical protein
MRTKKTARQRIVALASLVLVLIVVAPGASARASIGDPNPRILPITSRPFGLSYGQWGAAWWQYVYSIPVPTNPLLDQTGAQCGTGQAGRKVFFLVGVLNVSGTATRNCTVPAGTMLFFPLTNYEADNFCPPISPPLDVAGLQAMAKSSIDAVTALEADIDGVQITNPFGYRAASPGAFTITFPDNNLFQYFGCLTITAGSYAPFVSDGYWVMLAPLPPGAQTIHFSGSVPGFTLDITYHLTVTG